MCIGAQKLLVCCIDYQLRVFSLIKSNWIAYFKKKRYFFSLMKQIDTRLRQITNASKLETDQLKSDQMSKRGQIVKIPEFITPVCQIDLVFQW